MCRHSNYRLFLFVLSFMLTVCSTEAENAPESVKRHAFPVAEKVEELVQSMEIKQLVQDDFFLSRLQGVLSQDDFTEKDKVDTFYLMLKKIRWSFAGAVQIPPGSDYFSTFNGYVGTFFLYQKKLSFLQYDVMPLLNITTSGMTENVVRSSHALLLAVILDRDSADGVLKSLLDYDVIRKAQVPDILLHYLSLSVILARDHTLADRFGGFLDLVSSEEGKEDILCCLGIFSSTGIKEIRAFLLDVKEPDHDLAIETAITILRRRLDVDKFDSFIEKLITWRPFLREQLQELKKNNFKGFFAREGRGWLKTWDGFDLIIYDDGKIISYGKDFREFMH